MSLFINVVGGGQEWSDEIRFAHTQDTFELLRALDMLWERRSRRQRRDAVGAWAFIYSTSRKKRTPRSRCSTARPASAAAPCWKPWTRSTSNGASNTVYFAGAHGAVEYTPMRIAFTRIPDLDTER